MLLFPKYIYTTAVYIQERLSGSCPLVYSVSESLTFTAFTCDHCQAVKETEPQ